MSYSRPPAKSSGDVFDLTAYNAIRDSLIAGVPDLYTAKGDLAPATGADAAARLAVGANDSYLVADSGEATGMRWQPQPVVIVKNTGAFDPSTSSWVSVTWDAEDADTDGMHSTSTNTSRLTVQSGAPGYYIVAADIVFDTSSITPGTSGQYGVRIRYNGATVTRLVFDEAEMQSQDISMQVMGILGMSAADYVECQVWTSQNVDIGTDSRFEAIYQRPL